MQSVELVTFPRERNKEKNDLFKQTVSRSRFTLLRAYESCLAWQRSFLTEEILTSSRTIKFAMFRSAFGKWTFTVSPEKRQSTDSNKSVVGEPTTTITVRGKWIRTKLTQPYNCGHAWFKLKLLFSCIVHEVVYCSRYNPMPLIRPLALTQYAHVCL